MTGLWVALATLALGTLIGVVHLRRDGRVRENSGDRLSESDLGAGLGERATLVQFSTAFCQPCRATRRILADVSALVPGVRHVEVDAESRLDLVRRLDVTRTPTVLVLDPEGNVTKKATGQPRKADVLAALAAVVPASGPASGWSRNVSQQPDEM
ncbi:thioredoxin family protein [Nonomuraea sp. K274]|uniref:Thioredoxin family protein n=1 Tax=Nonomuraea cypriaca TaxID=1187855 RepID=A0A931A867_9ACTN|nr:thioredoxin family protein [Nonomuraea cypriaca]MBF8186795.1 thioredoxin family protein [Nonomuraea cypriaca]